MNEEEVERLIVEIREELVRSLGDPPEEVRTRIFAIAKKHNPQLSDFIINATLDAVLIPYFEEEESFINDVEVTTWNLPSKKEKVLN